MFVSLRQTMIQVIYSIIAIKYGSQRSHKGTIIIILEIAVTKCRLTKKEYCHYLSQLQYKYFMSIQKIGFAHESFPDFSIYL